MAPLTRTFTAPGKSQTKPATKNLVNVVEESPDQPPQLLNALQRLKAPSGLPAGLRQADVLTMQQNFGNRAVQRLLNNRKSPRSIVQRMPSRADFEQLAGKVSTKASLKGRFGKTSSYDEILNCLTRFEKADDASERATIAREIRDFCNDWLRGRDGNKDELESTRGLYIKGLLTEAESLITGQPPTLLNSSYLPTKSAEKQKEREANAGVPDYLSNDPKIRDAEPTRYVVTIAVARQNKLQLDMAYERALSTARNKVRGALTKLPGIGIRGSKKEGKGGEVIKSGIIKFAAPKTPEQSAKKAAKLVLQGTNEEVTEADINDLRDRSDQVGHSWIKFYTYVGENIQSIYSYGFYPEEGYGHPRRPVPGRVQHPDRLHDNDAETLFMDNEVNKKKYEQGLTLAQKQLAAKPDYVLIDFNCTTFAKEISEAAGVAFPSAARVFPGDASRAFVQKILSPNALYETLSNQQEKGDSKGEIYGKSLDIENDDVSEQFSEVDEQARQERVEARNQAYVQHREEQFSQLGLDNETRAHITRGTNLHVSKDKNEDQPERGAIQIPIHSFEPDSVTNALWIEKTSDDGTWTLVKWHSDGEITVGWVRSEFVKRND